ncbi:MAG: serine--tRNA ligase [Candidatus Nitrohelix vancouverensis]|uniref:Serine--tRNA ligase n=1 Tax=Candidatus Nitrohelix vancouverensis TaxID=2705534 RepID=A0A7T0C141_9BACT|nr:MAG: serine--tRNA ligase [Candidatus Nitrohelix vancouverensis]
MLDIKLIREDLKSVQTALERRGGDFGERLHKLTALDEARRNALQSAEALKGKNKKLSAEVGRLKKEGQNADALMEEVKSIKEQIRELDEKVNDAEAQSLDALLHIPNMPDATIPDGLAETDNRLERICGEISEFNFKPKNHVELGESLGLIDLKRAAKISGSRFAVYKNVGAQLMRGLINFMLDVQVRENGYEELYPPFLVNRESMTATGQLPKFEDDLFGMRDDPLYLIPTAEVPVTNYHRDETLPYSDLPRKYAAYTPCFRREAGSYGKDTQGLIRQHQFDKVELVKFVEPEQAEQELDALVADAESILKKLELPYRVMTLCAGDLGFSAAKTYDLEVWLPAQQAYREISSCSSFTDYQARRGSIKFKRKEGKPEFVHTLNGSGLAAGRLFVAILENYQQEDGSVKVPTALRPYLNGLQTIS